MPSPRPLYDPRWGPPLDEYLGYPLASFQFPLLPSELVLTAAIGNLYRGGEDVTYSTLEVILPITYRPRLMMLFLDQRAIASCMKLLRTYAARNHPSASSSLFEHAFGFLVLHVLALILQAGMLDSFDSDYIENLPSVLEDGGEYVWDIKAPGLAPTFLLALLDCFIADVPNPRKSRTAVAHYEFKWCKGTWGMDRACLPSVGGFAFRDAEFIVRNLFDNRKIFLECCLLPSSPSWSILVLVFHFHIKEQSLGDPRIKALWKKHYDLIFRYSLVSRVAKDSFLEPICGSYLESYNSEFEARSSAADVEDARRMQEAYTRKLRPNGSFTNQRGLLYTLQITWYVQDGLAKYLPLLLATGETTVDIIWDALTDQDLDETEPRWADIDLFLGECARPYL